MNTLNHNPGPQPGLQPDDIVRLRRQLARALGVTHFGWSLAGEVVDVVERMHGTISRAPLPWQTLRRDTALGLSGFIYRTIRRSFGQLSQSFAQASTALHPDADTGDGRWLQFQAALNGVCGDQIERENSPLAISMRLIGDVASPQDRQEVVFVHGLCMSELGWRNPAHEAFCGLLREQLCANITYLRYNSGRHISDNGAELSALLEARGASPLPLQLIGHSMGGLLIRSALLAAQQAGHRWPQRLSHITCLGTPHHGAPLERIGNQANRLLKLSPYLKPFSRLGDLRSAGIRDLRYGVIRESDWRTLHCDDDTGDHRQTTALPPAPRYLMLAASLSDAVPQAVWQARHDYLVPVASALGLSRDKSHSLSAPRLQRVVLPGLHHMDLLSQPAVYQQLYESMQG